MNKYIAREQTKVFRTLMKLGAASMERLSAVTHIPMIGVGYALKNLEEKGVVMYCKSELYICAI